MGGERMRLPGATEISAVAVAPEFRGQGLARSLISELVSRVTERHELPFLHVVGSSVEAIKLYESLGFTVRRSIDARIVAGPEQPPPQRR